MDGLSSQMKSVGCRQAQARASMCVVLGRAGRWLCRQGHTFVRVHDVFARCACRSELHVRALVSSLLCFCTTVHVTIITQLACTPSSMSALHGLAEKICISTAGWGRSPECRVLLMSGHLGGLS